MIPKVRHAAVLTAGRTGLSTLAVVAVALVLAGCSESAPTVDGSNPFGVDDDQISLLEFVEVTTAHCLGNSYPVEDKAQVVQCDEPGAVEVVAATAFGDDAPSVAAAPTPAVVGGYAEDVCTEHFAAWAEDNGTGTTPFLRVITFPDTWDGPGTPLICGARE